MYTKIKGFVGNVPIRLVATVLVAILIPSLLVTVLGLVAVYQADRSVKEQTEESLRIKLRELSARTSREWKNRFERYRYLLLDADERRDYLASFREEPGVVDLVVSDENGLHLVPLVPPAPELALEHDDPELREAQYVEAVDKDYREARDRYLLLFADSSEPAVQLESLLGASRCHEYLEKTDDALRYLDEALRRFGDTVDETGVLRKVPLLLRKVELQSRTASGARLPTARQLFVTLKELESGAEDDRLVAHLVRHYRQRLREFAPHLVKTLEGENDRPALARAIRQEALSGLETPLLKAGRRASPDQPVFVHEELLHFGEATFASFASASREVVVHLLLDRRVFLQDAELYQEDLEIPRGSLESGPLSGRSRSSARVDDQGTVSLAMHPPFQHLEWRFVPPSPAGFRSFKILSLATFTWTVIVLVLTIVVGATLTVRTVLQEMRTARMKTDFVSFISHELKTPLSSIRMLTETIREGRIDNEDELKLCLQMVDQESARLTGLIDRVLEYSRIQSHQKVFHFTSASMDDVVREAVRLFHKRQKDHTRQVEVHSVQHISKIKMDRASMVEVILNLLSNASKYSKPDKKIFVNLRESIDEITVEVVDRGVGIRKRDQRRIFEKFYRAEDYLTRDVEGYGLGLAFARYIARQHKGDIKVISQVNSGSTFVLCLRKTDVMAE